MVLCSRATSAIVASRSSSMRAAAGYTVTCNRTHRLNQPFSILPLDSQHSHYCPVNVCNELRIPFSRFDYRHLLQYGSWQAVHIILVQSRNS